MANSGFFSFYFFDFFSPNFVVFEFWKKKSLKCRFIFLGNLFTLEKRKFQFFFSKKKFDPQK
jgi:hypothetical protein